MYSAQEFLKLAEQAAVAGNHPWKIYAACEAALESAWGSSELAQHDNNLLGMKQHTHPVYGTHAIPTKEFLGGQWVMVDAEWIHYPDWASCFADRITTIRRLASVYPHYAAALAAPTGEEFVIEVSKTWSTDPDRAKKVLDIFQRYYINSQPAQDYELDGVEGRLDYGPLAPPKFVPQVPIPDGLK